MDRMVESYSSAETAKPDETSLPRTKISVAAEVADAEDLTKREVEILRLIARGSTDREVADVLVISEGTVKNHLSNIFARLRLRDRTQAVMYARERGLL